MSYLIREYFILFREKDIIAAGLLFFAALPAVIYGREKNRIVKKPFADFAIRILQASMDPKAGYFKRPKNCLEK